MASFALQDTFLPSMTKTRMGFGVVEGKDVPVTMVCPDGPHPAGGLASAGEDIFTHSTTISGHMGAEGVAIAPTMQK